MCFTIKHTFVTQYIYEYLYMHKKSRVIFYKQYAPWKYVQNKDNSGQDIVLNFNDIISYANIVSEFDLYSFALRQFLLHSIPSLKVCNLFIFYNKTHTFRCFLNAFLSLTDLLLRNLFLSYDVTMIALKSFLFINEPWLTLAHFFLIGIK